MAEVKQIAYKHTELVELMLRDQGITEGLWIILVNFGFGAGNMGESPEKPDTISPVALVAIQSIGLQRVPAPGPLVVDASKLKKVDVPS